MKLAAYACASILRSGCHLTRRCIPCSSGFGAHSQKTVVIKQKANPHTKQVFRIIQGCINPSEKGCHWTCTFRYLAKTQMALDARTRMALELILSHPYSYNFHPSCAIVVQITLKHLVEINLVAAVRTLLAIGIVCAPWTLPVPHK